MANDDTGISMEDIMNALRRIGDQKTVKSFGIKEETKSGTRGIDAGGNVTNTLERKEYTISFDHEVYSGVDKVPVPVEVQYNPETKEYSLSDKMKEMGVSLGKAEDNSLVVKIDNNKFKDSAAETRLILRTMEDRLPSELIIRSSDIQSKIDSLVASATEAPATAPAAPVAPLSVPTEIPGGIVLQGNGTVANMGKPRETQPSTPAEVKPTGKDYISSSVETIYKPEGPMFDILSKKESAPDVRGVMGILETPVGSELNRTISSPAEVPPQAIVVADDAKKAKVILTPEAEKEFKEHAQGHAAFGNKDAGTLVALAQIQINKLIESGELKGVEPLKVDGKLQGKTEAALKAFQKSQDFDRSDQDGILGEQTWSALRETMKGKDGKVPIMDDLKKELQDMDPKVAAQVNAYDAARDGLKQARGGEDVKHVQAPAGGTAPQRQKTGGRDD